MACPKPQFKTQNKISFDFTSAKIGLYFCRMARKKLKRFQDNEAYAHVVEPTREEASKGIDQRGKWKQWFGKDAPLVLELGCGKGEYTIALAKDNPETLFVGVDIKGARIWYGATEAHEMGLRNAAFLRTEITLIDGCFAEGEVDEIWITFPDPQIKFRRTKHRLTHPKQLDHYARLLKPGGTLHLKTDSAFLHGYTLGVLEGNDAFVVEEAFFDIDHQLTKKDSILHTVQTHYETMFRNKGNAITYLRCTRV